MRKQEITANEITEWKNTQRLLYASCSKSQRKLFCTLSGNYEVYKKGELILETNQPYLAAKKYNEL